MKTDRELLELAAKAAAIAKIKWNDRFLKDPHASSAGGWLDGYGSPSTWWNPLTDDGDALRLAVELRICIEFFGVYKQHGHSGVCCTGILHGQPVVNTDYAKQGENVSAATRRAIVRTAAAIGEFMP